MNKQSRCWPLNLLFTLVSAIQLSACSAPFEVDTESSYTPAATPTPAASPTPGLSVTPTPTPTTTPDSPSDDIYEDINTNLVWQKKPGNTPRTWQEALDYCENLELATFTDWRLPDVHELESIVDLTAYQPAVTSLLKEYTQPLYYWTNQKHYDWSTRKESGQAWVVNFLDGGIIDTIKGMKAIVRCVRKGPLKMRNCAGWDTAQYRSEPDRFIAKYDDKMIKNNPPLSRLHKYFSGWMIKDRYSGLKLTVFTTNGAYYDYTYDSNHWCGGFLNSYRSKGFQNIQSWRTPTRRELLSLIDYGFTTPAVNDNVKFKDALLSSPYWASDYSYSSGTQMCSASWAINFTDGRSFIRSGDTADFFYTVCVTELPECD